MKAVVTGDWHIDCWKIGQIDPETDLDLRVLDFLNAIDFMIDHAIEIKADLFIMNGDLFKGRYSSHLIETLMASRFTRISKHMKLIINLGNHDYTPKQLAYGTYTYSVLEKFCNENFEVYTDITHLKFDDMDLVLYPYYDLKRVNFDSNDELIEWIGNEIDKFDLTKSTKLFVGHGTPAGTIMNEDYLFDLGLIEEPVLPHTLFEQFDKVLFSHIHRRSEITERIMHIGSPERVDFSEHKDDKGFVVFDSEDKSTTWVSTNPRPMADIKLKLGEFDDPTEEIIKSFTSLPNLEDTMVKISVELPQKAYALVDHVTIRKELANAFWHKGPIFDVPKTNKVRVEGLTEELSASQALEKVLATKDIPEADVRQILLRGRGILVGADI